MKKLSIGATALMGALFLSGCGESSIVKNSSVTNIERVLKADSTTVDGATSVAEIVSRMRAISLTGCPQDFTAAYVVHIHAWESLAEVERDAAAFDADFNSTGAVVESFFRGVMGDPFGKTHESIAEQNRLRANWQRALTQIRETFQRAEELAVTHGAELPKKDARNQAA